MLYRRCIDDIVGAASCPEKELQCFIDHATNFYPSIKYTYGISNNTVTFLDLQLTIDNNHIKSCVHFEPTDSHNYLLFSSSHPPSCKHSIPFSQMLQINRCTDNYDVIMISNFNPPSHFTLIDFSVTGIIHCNYSNVNRLNIENHIIFKLGILFPLGLSTKFCAFSLTYFVITQLFSPVEGFILETS